MLRLSELYTSVQGEGPRTGQMTCFVRFAGCNMRCPGWPCDTPYAIFPELYRKDSERLDPESLAVKIIQTCEEVGAMNVCLTGGEPFLQPHVDLQIVVKELVTWGLTIECFSNGSFVYPEWALNTIDFIMDWKLTGSGESTTNMNERLQNVQKLKHTDAIKFVVGSRQDLLEAESVWRSLDLTGIKAEFWVGAVWGKIHDETIVKFIKANKLPWKLNVQVHKHIWPAAKRGV